MPSQNQDLNGARAFDLQEGSDTFQKLADLNPNLLFIIALQDKKIVYINQRVQELLGFDPDSVYEKGPDIFKIALHPDDYERRMENMENCRNLPEQEESKVEVRLRTPRSGWQWFRITEKIFKRDEDGNVVQLIGTAQNIHEQKSSEEKLREEHRRLKNAQAIGHIGSYERELPGDRIYCSEEFFRIHGREAMAGYINLEEFVSYVHPDEQPAFWAAIHHTHETGKALDLVTRILRPDGSIRHVHRRSALIKNEDGVPIRVYGTVQDITDRIKAEEERKKSESLMRSTEIVAGTGSYEIHVASDRIYFSDGLFRLFGEEPGSFTPTSAWIDSRSHPDDTENVQQILNLAAEKKEPYTYIRRIYRKDGEMRVLQAQGNVVTDDEGKPVKFIGLVQDITERQKAEEELRSSEERSRNLLKVLQNAPDAYLVLTPDLVIKIASDAYLRDTMTTREQIIDQKIFDVFPDNPEVMNPTGVKNLSVSFSTVLSTGKPHRMAMQHYDVKRPDGSYETKYWSPTNTPVLGADGEIEYIIHRVIDITDVVKKQNDVKGLANETDILKTSLEEIKLQAQQLKESREMLQTIFDASPNSIILYKTIYTPEGSIEDFEFLMVNAYNHNIIGITDDLVGHRFTEEFPEAVKTEVLQQFKNTAETGAAADFEVRHNEDGSEHWFHFRATKLNDMLVVTSEDITKRKKSEQELLRLKDELAQQAKDQYRKIINSMDEGFCLLEVIFDEADNCINYRFLDRNPKFEEQTGLTDVVGKTVNELVSIEPYWTNLFGKVAKTGETLRLEHQVSGINRWIEGYAFRIGAPKDRQVAFIFKNTTERKLAEKRQAFFIELNDALQSVTEQEDIQKTAVQMLGKHLDVNRAHYAEALADSDTMVNIGGYYKDVDPLPRQLKISDYDPAIREKYMAGEILVINDTLKDLPQTSGLKKGIDAFKVRAFISFPLVKNSQLIALLGIHQSTPRSWTSEEVDLVREVCERIWTAGERNRVERALRESEQRFRNLVESSALAVWEANPEGLVETDSPSWRAFTGQSYEEWLGAGWANAIHPDDRQSITEKWKQTIASGSNLDMEFRLNDVAGRYRWVNVKATPILNTEGRITKWSGMNLDIHDRKQAEEALLQAKEEAEAASRAKEDFVSTMSHEIRTPLNAVIGFTNLLLEQNPREDQKDKLNALSFSAENLLTLINEILDFSKLESGKVKLAENTFELSELLHNLLKVHRSQAVANRTTIELDLDEKIPRYIATDQLKLSQILHNLVSNAVKFTENGLVQICVELNEQEEDALWLDFSIRDTGIGIPAKKLDYVFEKFTQAEEATLRNYGGTGLGLSITKLLLDVMGSEIKVESRAGEGSNFYFSLPVKIASGKSPEAKTPEDHDEDTGELREMRLLLVEDVEINREILIQFLENWWKIKPDEAVNGKEAVEMARNNNYDLVLMDIRMPVMDGIEATRQIRELPGCKNIPILALTADKNQEEQQAKKATQFDDLLTKPFKPTALKQRIIHHLVVAGKITEKTGNIFLQENGKAAEEPILDNNGLAEKEQKEPALDISRYTKMAGNHREVLRKWIKSSIVAFETYREEFTTAANGKDLQLLSDLIHKNTSSIFYIQANPLAAEIENFRTLLRDPNVDQDDLDQQKTIVLNKFGEVVEGLKTLKENKT